MSQEVILYSYFRSSASWRVRIALHWKRIPFTYHPVHLLRGGGEQYRDDYGQVNPMHEVPSLCIDGVVLSQSLPIIEYLDETRPEPRLLPTTPLDRARARQIAECVNASMQPLQNLKVLKKLDDDFAVGEAGKAAWARHWLTAGFEGIERLLERHAGSHAVGNAVTIADVCLVPQVFNGFRFGVEMDRFRRVLAVHDAVASLPAFAAAHPSVQPDSPEQAS
jgi:maleylacetoacetate isomerase